MRNKNAIFLGEPGGSFELTREATWKSELSSCNGKGSGLGENLGWVLGGGAKSGTSLCSEPSWTVVVGEVMVIIRAKGKQRSKAQKRESGVGDSMVFFPSFSLCSVEWKESDFETDTRERI